MYAVCVTFVIKEENLPDFLVAIKKQASDSVSLEPGCHHFDVCQKEGDRTTIFLYELYTDEAAFKVHVETPHFASFGQKIKDWVISKDVAIFERVADGS